MKSNNSNELLKPPLKKLLDKKISKGKGRLLKEKLSAQASVDAALVAEAPLDLTSPPDQASSSLNDLLHKDGAPTQFSSSIGLISESSSVQINFENLDSLSTNQYFSEEILVADASSAVNSAKSFFESLKSKFSNVAPASPSEAPTNSEIQTGSETPSPSPATTPTPPVTPVTSVISSAAGLSTGAMVGIGVGGALALGGGGGGGSSSSSSSDTTAPTVSSIAITSATGALNSTLNAGDVVVVTVTMSESVKITGAPQLALNIGGTTVQASYASGTGTSALVFNYTILAGQTDTDGISIDANSLTLNSGTILDLAGNAATRTHSAVADSASFLVDTTAPVILSLVANSNGGVAGAGTMVLTYDSTLDSANPPIASNFTVTTGGSAKK